MLKAGKKRYAQRMSRLIELSHENAATLPQIDEWLPGMVLQSVGPIPHQVNVPFHDSQAGGKAILIQTGWDGRWGTESYWEPGPVLSEDTIFRLVRSGVRLLGVDFWVSGRSAETRLVVSGKLPIVENLFGLSSLPRWGFRFGAVPIQPPTSGASYAVRAFAEITS
jgi:kynurenine formamidase